MAKSKLVKANEKIAEKVTTGYKKNRRRDGSGIYENLGHFRRSVSHQRGRVCGGSKTQAE